MSEGARERMAFLRKQDGDERDDAGDEREQRALGEHLAR